MYPIKKSTAQPLLFFLHDTSGNPVTGKVDGNFTKRISKGGAPSFGAMTVTVTEAEGGWYSMTLSTSHTDTLGILTIYLTCGGAMQVNLQFRVETTTLSDLFDAQDSVETGLTVRGAMRLMAAVLAGRAEVTGTGVVFNSAVADNKARITAVVNEEGDRAVSGIDTT